MYLPFRERNLVLTIDEVIQFIAERELEAKVKRTNAEGGLIIAMDPSTAKYWPLQFNRDTIPTSTMSTPLKIAELRQSPIRSRQVLPSNQSLPLQPLKAALWPF